MKELESETEDAKSTVMRLFIYLLRNSFCFPLQKDDCIVSYLINRLKEEENALMESLYSGRNEIKKIAEEVTRGSLHGNLLNILWQVIVSLKNGKESSLWLSCSCPAVHVIDTV